MLPDQFYVLHDQPCLFLNNILQCIYPRTGSLNNPDGLYALPSADNTNPVPSFVGWPDSGAWFRSTPHDLAKSSISER
jgi:hypothetical protein